MNSRKPTRYHPLTPPKRTISHHHSTIVGQSYEDGLGKLSEQERKFEKLYAQFSMLDPTRFKYSQDTFMPYLFFFKFLAKRNAEESKAKLRMWIPDTIIVNDRDLSGMWFYSGADGYVYRTDSFTARNAVQKFCDGTQTPDELVAVIKKPHFRNMELIGNETKPVIERETQLLFSTVLSVKGETTCLQRFVRCKGQKAYIVRTIWKKDGKSCAWVITNKTGFNDPGDFASRCLTNTSKCSSCTIIQCTSGLFLEETLPHVMDLKSFLHQAYQVEFEEIGCDFIKEQDGRWYFINLRGFVLAQGTISVFTRHMTHDDSMPFYKEEREVQQCYKMKVCKFCQIPYPAQEMKHQLTMKMLMELDQHLLLRNLNLKWVEERVDFCHIDIAMLFHRHYVCDSCYELYKACEQLNELTYRTALVLGIQSVQKNNTISITQQDYKKKGRNYKKRSKHTESVDVSYLEQSTTEMEIPLEKQKPVEHLRRYRVLIYVKQISQIPADVLSSRFMIYYEFLNQHVKIKLNIRNQPIDAAKLFYVFAEDRSQLNQILSQITFSLIQNNELFGEFQCELDDFKSQNIVIRDFIKYFSGFQITSILSWATELSIGLDESQFGQINVASIPLTKFGAVYLPPVDYYCCEPLHVEWMNQFSRKLVRQNMASFAISDMSNILDQSRVAAKPARELKRNNMLLEEIFAYEKETSKLLDN